MLNITKKSWLELQNTKTKKVKKSINKNMQLDQWWDMNNNNIKFKYKIIKYRRLSKNKKIEITWIIK